MISIAFFSVLLGFVGLLLAVPLAILVRMVVERAIAALPPVGRTSPAPAPRRRRRG